MKELTILHIPQQDNAPARVRVCYRPETGAQAQEREIDFGFSISDEQRRLIQWYLEEFLIYPWGEFRNRAKQVEELMTRLGVEFFDALFSNRETLALYAHVADDLPNTRIVVHASDPEGIALPWELMRDQTRGEYGDLACLAYAFVRSQPDLIFQAPPALAGDLLNILMVICRPTGERDVPFQTVARPLLELFRPHHDRINLEVLRPPTLKQLARALKDKPNFYHVLHFDGHGAFPQGSGRFYELMGPQAQGRLIFEGEDGNPSEVTGEKLGDLLAGKGVAVVLLNACQSGMTRPESLYPSVGNQLLKGGVRGVVAMAYSVYVQTAVRFMARLYEGLLNGEELSRAVYLARDELRTHPGRFSALGEVPLRDWMVPIMLETAPFALLPHVEGDVRLNPSLLQDQQAKSGAEIDCPERPAFGLVGRDGVMLRLERAFQRETIVLLEGMAGVGKSETAMGLARWWAETGALSGPIFFFRFERHLLLAHLCDRVGQVLDEMIRQQLRVEWHLLDAAQQHEVAVAILKQVPCLMIWDNFERVAGFPAGTPAAWTPDEQKELRDFLSALRGGQTKVLLISRRDERWLGNIYRRVEVRGLKLVETQELAMRVMRRVGLSPGDIREPEKYSDLLKYLQGNPQTIQVVLPELKRTRPNALLSMLQAGEAMLGEDDTMPGRERSLSASLSYGFDRLDPDLQCRLSLLGFFQGYVDAYTLAVMCRQEGMRPELKGRDRAMWQADLDVAASIGVLTNVYPGSGAYTTHPALPWFFHASLQAHYGDAIPVLTAAYADAYGALGQFTKEQFGTDPQITIIALGYEEDNLRHAFRLACQRERWEAAQKILDGLGILLETLARWTEWERILVKVATVVTDTEGKPIAGREKLWRVVARAQGNLAERRKDFATAEAIYLRLREHYELLAGTSWMMKTAGALTDAERESAGHLAGVLDKLGFIASQHQQWKNAEDYYRQSMIIKEHIGDERGYVSTSVDLSAVVEAQGRRDEADRLKIQSLNILEKRLLNEIATGNPQPLQEAMWQHERGIAEQTARRFDQAKSYFRQSLMGFELIGDNQKRAATLHHLGINAQEQGLLDEAESWHRQSLMIRVRIGDKQGQAISLNELGNIAQQRQQFEEAERWYRRGLAIAKDVGDKEAQLTILRNLGNVALELAKVAWSDGKIEKAEKWYRQSLMIRGRINDEQGQASILVRLGAISEKRGRISKAEDWYRRSLTIAKRTGDEHGQAIAVGLLGLLAMARKQWDEADALLQEAAKMFERTGDSHTLANMQGALELLAQERAQAATRRGGKGARGPRNKQPPEREQGD
jgi:tetratricopeptide (TPR) repeat protein